MLTRELKFDELGTGGPVAIKGVGAGTLKRRESARLLGKAVGAACGVGLDEAPSSCGCVSGSTACCVRGGPAFLRAGIVQRRGSHLRGLGPGNRLGDRRFSTRGPTQNRMRSGKIEGFRHPIPSSGKWITIDITHSEIYHFEAARRPESTHGPETDPPLRQGIQLPQNIGRGNSHMGGARTAWAKARLRLSAETVLRLCVAALR